MEPRDYRSSIVSPLPPAEALERISRVSDWWTRSFSGRARETGDTFQVRFGETFVEFAVAERVPGTRVVWEVTDCNLHWLKDKKEWNDTRVVWEVAPRAAGSTVTMTHSGLTPEVECYPNCESGWNFYVGKSLLKLLEENSGLPDGK
jgi:hypothetical protein